MIYSQHLSVVQNCLRHVYYDILRLKGGYIPAEGTHLDFYGAVIAEIQTWEFKYLNGIYKSSNGCDHTGRDCTKQNRVSRKEERRNPEVSPKFQQFELQANETRKEGGKFPGMMARWTLIHNN